MATLPLFLLLFSPFSLGAETYVWFQPWSSAAQLVEILKTTKEGKGLVEEALKRDPKLLEHIHAGKASYTENLGMPGKVLQRIMIKRGHKLSDATADLAHELLHFSLRKPLDPYDKNFAKSTFVRDGIESSAGELAAFRMECAVAWSLEKAHPAFPKHAVCDKFRKAGDEFDSETARLAYYAIGKWHGKFDPELKEKLKELSAGAPVFTSGFSGKPYPVSLVSEFSITLDAACERNRGSYKMLAHNLKAIKGPVPPSLLEEKMKFENFHEQQCRASNAPGKK